jgi:hypothetical protein
MRSMEKNPPRTRLRRRDATGHLDPRYAAELLERSRENQTSDPPPAGFVNNESDDLAEELAEEFVRAATSAEDGDSDAGDELITGELGVPQGDDDDLDFEPEELAYHPAKGSRRKPEPARKAAKAKPSRAAKAKPVKAKPAKAIKAKAKPAKAVKAKAKPVEAKPAKAVKAKAKPAKAKTKAAKSKVAKAKPGRKKAKRKPGR